MKKIAIFGCLLMSLMILGTGCGNSKFTEEAVTDQTVIEHLNDLAKENLEKYFGITVDNAAKMQGTVTKYTPKEGADASELLILLEKQEGEPAEGELYSYQIMVDSKTEEVKGLYYGVYSEAEPQTFSDEQLDEIGRSFIKEKGMVADTAELSLLKVEKVNGAEYIQSLTYQYGEDYLLVNVNKQDGKVMSFEYAV